MEGRREQSRITDLADGEILDMAGGYIKDLMGLTKSNVTTLANNLLHSKGDSDTLSASFDDVMDRLARTTGPFTNTEAYTPTDGTKEYSYPTTAIKLLAAIHGSTELPEATGKELEAIDIDWRSADEDDPVVHSFVERDARKVLLWPTPDTTTSSGGLFIFTEKREEDIGEWLGLALALEIVGEEMSYPSDHQSMELSAGALKLARILKAFIGI